MYVTLPSTLLTEEKRCHIILSFCVLHCVSTSCTPCHAGTAETAQLKGQLARVAYKLRSTNEEYKKCIQEREQQTVTLTRLTAENATFREVRQMREVCFVQPTLVVVKKKSVC